MSDRAEDVFYAHGGLRTEVCDAATLDAITESLAFAQQMNWDSVRTPHLFMGLLARPDNAVQSWVFRMSESSVRLCQQFRDLFYQDLPPSPPLLAHREFFSDNTIRVLRDAWIRAQDHGRSRFNMMDLLVSVLSLQPSIVADCFERFGYDAGMVTGLALQAEQEASLPGS
jgi:ATP-dependent Clp protease ATP-binding subunit ClpA